MSTPQTDGQGINLHAIRAQFPALANYVWFQNGGVSITPEPVAREHIQLMEELLARGPRLRQAVLSGGRAGGERGARAHEPHEGEKRGAHAAATTRILAEDVRDPARPGPDG